MKFIPQDPDYKKKVLEAWDKQIFLNSLGLKPTVVEPGYCELVAPITRALFQSWDYVAGGVLGSIADAVAGFAAYSLVPKGTSMLTVEYKINFLRPVTGEKVLGRGTVEKAGKTLTIVRAEVYAVNNGEEKLAATASVTMISIHQEKKNV